MAKLTEIKKFNIATLTNVKTGKIIYGLYTDSRIEKESVPKGFHKYDLRHSDWGDQLVTVEPYVWVNFGATIITIKPIRFRTKEYEYNGKLVKDKYVKLTVEEYDNITGEYKGDIRGDYDFEINNDIDCVDFNFSMEVVRRLQDDHDSNARSKENEDVVIINTAYKILGEDEETLRMFCCPKERKLILEGALEVAKSNRCKLKGRKKLISMIEEALSSFSNKDE